MKNAKVSKSKVISSEQIDKYINTVGRETVAEIATTITDRLQEACENVGNVYLEMERKFPEVMAVMGFAAIATCNALPIEAEHAPICVVVGTAGGIQHAAQPLIEAFSKISREAEHDRKTRG